MNVLPASGFAVAGAIGGIPIAAIAYSAPAHGSLRLPGGWWRGAPARPTAVVLVSLLAGVAAGLVARRLPWSPALPAFWALAVIGVGLAIIDVRRRRLPYALTGTAGAVSLICFAVDAAALGTAGALLRALVAGTLTALAMLTMALAFSGQLGLGDVALLGVVNLNLAWLSWQAALAGVLIAFMLQGILVLTCKGRTETRATSPMGPAIWAGWLLAVFVS